MDCILHIGPSKTGSSSIQGFLRYHEGALASRGVALPRLSKMAMTELSLAFRETFSARNASLRLGMSPRNYRRKQAEILNGFATRFQEARAAGMTKAIITAEGLAHLGLKDGANPRELTNLRDWLAQHFATITVVPVLRRQDLRAVSRYKNIVKNHGWTERRSLVHGESMDLDVFLPLWASAFSQENIRPILFPDSVPEPRDLIADFCTVAGIEGLYTADQAELFKRNASLDGRAIEVMRLLNLAQPSRHLQGSNKLLRRFYAHLERAFEPPLQKATPSRQEVEDFLARYEDGNRAVQQTYFPDRADLFSDDLSRYPENSVYPEVSSVDLAHLLAQVLYDPRLLKMLDAAQRPSEGAPSDK